MSNTAQGRLGARGVAPTSLSMVYMGLTGKTDKTPADMAELATQNGYAADDEGTIGCVSDGHGAKPRSAMRILRASSASLLTYLKESGYVVIVNVGPGDFTTAGHFFVATGEASGRVRQDHDPYSNANSSVTWDADVVANQSIAMYAFKAQS